MYNCISPDQGPQRVAALASVLRCHLGSSHPSPSDPRLWNPAFWGAERQAPGPKSLSLPSCLGHCFGAQEEAGWRQGLPEMPLRGRVSR